MTLITASEVSKLKNIKVLKDCLSKITYFITHEHASIMYWLLVVAVVLLITLLRWVSHEMDKAITYRPSKPTKVKTNFK